MCGIIGVVGAPDAASVLVKSLQRLTYRGYDSAGIVTSHEGQSFSLKCPGKLTALKQALEGKSFPGSVGIGHTRWATHGAPNQMNAHPHSSSDSRYHVICNGIIENFRELKKRLIAKGYIFSSETDSEVLPALLQSYSDNFSFQEKLIKLVKELEGSFAFVVMDTQNPSQLWAARRGSPLLAAKNGKARFLASDVPAILEYTRDVLYLEDEQIVGLLADDIVLMDFNGQVLPIDFQRVDFNLEEAEKEGYPHFMLKEIHEQPSVVERTFKAYLTPDGIDFSSCFDEESLKNIDEVIFVACGTAYHSGIVGQYFLESLGIRARCLLASEFHLFPSPLTKNSLVIVMTQSGETIDTLYALRRAKKMGAPTLAVCNVKGATIVREADMAIMMHAGPEIGVASTKAYSTMLAVISLFGPWLAHSQKRLPESFDFENYCQELKSLPQKMKKVLNQYDDIKDLLKQFSHFNDYFYIARGFNLPTALEGALKLKEITYLHAEGYGAGEMKHGPIALVDDRLLTIAIAPHDGLEDKIASNIEEIKARGGHVFLIASENSRISDSLVDGLVRVPETRPELFPLLTVIPLQILAYEVAVSRDCDPDQPRNLAKSVTVE